METQLRTLLTGNHTFPGPYRLKVIGENSPAFQERVVDAASATLDRPVLEVQVRPSAGNKHVGLTLTLGVNDADEVLKVYAALRALPGVRMVL